MPLERSPHPHSFTLGSILDSLAGLIMAGVEQLVTISGVENTSSQCCRNLGKCCQLSMWTSWSSLQGPGRGGWKQRAQSMRLVALGADAGLEGRGRAWAIRLIWGNSGLSRGVVSFINKKNLEGVPWTLKDDSTSV